jgi:hypothetical protein
MTKRGHRDWRGKHSIPERGDPIVRQFYEVINTERLLVIDIAKKTGIAPETIAAWRQRNPRLGLFHAALNSMGYELCIRKRETAG